MSLNPSQTEAVETLRGPMLVLAGAGSGKTRVVTYRIANLIRHGIKPERILAVTFTNKAAREMKERAEALLGKKLPAPPEISTFHSLCVRILRRQIRALGYPPEFAIYDRGDQESMARGVLRELKAPATALRPGDLLQLIGRWKNRSLGPAEAARDAATDAEHLAAVAYRRYQESLKLAGALDFDDLLLFSEELFTKHPEARAAEARRFDHVLVDEYQDTNGSQYRIIRALAGEHRNLCVVGDDDQSIYGWRGAEVQHILRFQRDWTNAKVVRLEENYRSTEAILSMANRLIAHNKQRHDKVLRAMRRGGERPRILQFPDETAQAEQVVEEIRSQIFARKAEPRDFAILFRTNEQPRAFETALRREKLPYVLIGGMSFFDRKEVRDILAYFKLLAQPQDEVSARRVINTPPRGIGAKAVQRLTEEAVARGVPLWNVLSEAERLNLSGPMALEGVKSFQRLIEKHRARLGKDPLVDICADLIHEIKYREEIARNYPDPNEQTARWSAVEELVNALAAYTSRKGKSTIDGFLEEMLLSGRDEDRDKESNLARNAIVLMTLHSAKGLEFPQVYMVGMEEGFLPHHRSAVAEGSAIDEERRLCYVGVTRARDRLTLTLALSRLKWGKTRPTVPSRFLFELLGAEESEQAMQALKAARAEMAHTDSDSPVGPKGAKQRKPAPKPTARKPAPKRGPGRR